MKNRRSLLWLFLLFSLSLQSIGVVRATNTVVSPLPEDETKAENNADYDLFLDDNNDDSAAAASTAATMPSLSKPRRWGESCSSTANADGTSISGNKSNNTPTSASSASTISNVPYQPSSSSLQQQQQQQPDTSSSAQAQAGLPPILLFGVKNNGNGNGNSKNQQQQQQQQYKPPEGYVLAGRVYTDDRTNRAVLDLPSDEERVLTYFDCGVTGSTTPTLDIQSAVIRHAISTTPLIRGRRRRQQRRRNQHTKKQKNRPRQPTSKTTGGHDIENKGSDKAFDDEIEQVTDDADDGDENGAEDDDDEEEEEDGGSSYFSLGSPPMDQLLLIALSEMEVELDGGGGTLLLEPGQIVLFQETNPCQHTCRPIDDDMTMMLLTLPLTVDTNRILGIVRPSDGKQHQHGPPCPTDEAAAAEAATTAVTRVSPRKYVLGGFGFTLSLLVADFLGKVAPLWLSVGVGGTCFVGGTTYAFVQSVDPLCETLHYWWKERHHHNRRSREEAEEQEQEEEESNQEATTTTSPQEPLLFLQHQFRDDVEYPVQQDEDT